MGFVSAAFQNLHQFLKLLLTLWKLSSEGIGQQLTTTVAKELDEQWLPCLAWARARVTQPVTPVSDSTITDA